MQSDHTKLGSLDFASNAILLTPPLIFPEEGSTDVKTGASKLMTP
jgi:hypothetical protein